MKKIFLLASSLCFGILTANAQLIKNDFFAAYSVGDNIEKYEYSEGVSGSRDAIKENQWNLTRITNSRSGVSPKAIAPLIYQGYIESGKNVAIEIPKLDDGNRSTVYSLVSKNEYGPGTYYLAFMVNVDFVKRTPIEFFSFDADYAGSTQRVRFAVKGKSSKSYQMALNGSNKIEDVVIADPVHQFGETCLVVIKTVFNAEGEGNCYLFINPDVNAAEPTPSISTPLTGLKAIRGITVRQRNSSSIAAKIGGIRFSKSWDAIFK